MKIWFRFSFRDIKHKGWTAKRAESGHQFYFVIPRAHIFAVVSSLIHTTEVGENKEENADVHTWVYILEYNDHLKYQEAPRDADTCCSLS